jgi:hypothetical protein
VLVADTHSAPPEQAHCTICPQLSVRVTPQAPSQGSVGEQHVFE